MLLGPGADDVGGQLPVPKVLDEAALDDELRAIEVARGQKDPWRNLRLQTGAARRLRDRRRDHEVLAADPERVADRDVELDEKGRVNEDPARGPPELVPAICGLREDGAVDRVLAVDRDEVDQSAALGLLGEGHRTEAGDPGRRLERGRFDRLECLEDLGPEAVATLEPQVGAEQLLRPEIDRFVHRLAKGVKTHDDGDADRHAAAVETEATGRGAQLAPDHREDEARPHRAPSPLASPRARRQRDPRSRSDRCARRRGGRSGGHGARAPGRG